MAVVEGTGEKTKGLRGKPTSDRGAVKEKRGEDTEREESGAETGKERFEATGTHALRETEESEEEDADADGGGRFLLPAGREERCRGREVARARPL